MKFFSFIAGTTYNLAALRVTLIYAGFSLLWILFSDQILFFLVKDAEILTKIQMVKGWAFVFATSFIIYLLLLREMLKAKSAEESLNEGEKSYREIFDSTTEAISIHSAEDGSILDFNRSMSDMFGYSYDEVSTLNIRDLSLEDHLYSHQESMRFIKKAIKDGPHLFEWKFRRKNGEYFWSEVTMRFSEIGGEKTVIAVTRDITDRKLAEEALLRKNMALKVVSELTKAAISAKEEEDLLQDTCRILVEHGGYVMAWAGYVEADDHESIKPLACYGYEQGLGTADITLQCETDHGLIYEAIGNKGSVVANDITNDPKFETLKNTALHRGFQSLIAIPLFEDDKSIGALNIYSQDINAFDVEEVNLLDKISLELQFALKNLKTEKEKQQMELAKSEIEKQLDQTQKMEAIGTLAGGIAHDFNNILTVIIGYSELVKSVAESDPDQLANVEAVLNAGHRAKDLVNQILVFSHQSPVEIVPIRLQPVIKEVLKMMRSSIPSTIEIRDNIFPDCGLIDADPTQIHQIIMNLCTNSFHAMEKTGGVLTVELKPAEEIPIELQKPDGQEYIELSVHDTGSGIPSGYLDNIFDPFFTTKTKGKGTGMGLAITYRIVEKYGGSILVESDSEKGTCFRLYFPSKTDEIEKEETAVEEVPRGSERILYVDDEEVIVNMGKKILGGLGYHVTGKKSSVDALRLFKDSSDQFDLVITDQTMPDITGIDMAVEMLGIRPDIPIILCTGYSNLIDEKSSKMLGISRFIYKPITKGIIGKSVREVLDERGQTV